jgi:hypothetical protein
VNFRQKIEHEDYQEYLSKLNEIEKLKIALYNDSQFPNEHNQRHSIDSNKFESPFKIDSSLFNQISNSSCFSDEKNDDVDFNMNFKIKKESKEAELNNLSERKKYKNSFDSKMTRSKSTPNRNLKIHTLTPTVKKNAIEKSNLLPPDDIKFSSEKNIPLTKGATFQGNLYSSHFTFDK